MAKYLLSFTSQDSYKSSCKVLKEKKCKHNAYAKLSILSIDASDRAELAQLVDLSNVSHVQEDITVKLIKDKVVETSANPKAALPWGIERIGASYTSIPKKYSRPKTAILDTGLSVHPALNVSSRYVNFTNERSAIDRNGHGTHIAGTIGGFSRSMRSNRFHGVYPALPLTSIKAFDSDGSAKLSAIIKGIEWAINNGIRIINMSYGIDEHQPVLHDAIKAATRQNILMIAASGNDGTPYVTYPARYPEVIAVGSTNRDNQISSFSQYGNSLDLVAPGEDIFSTWINRSYKSISGTSMACAHVTGAATLVLAVKPNATASEIKNLLLTSTEKLSASYLMQGNGLISVSSLIEKLRS